MQKQAIKSIYLAGKIQLIDHNYPDWRESIVHQQAFDTWSEIVYGHDNAKLLDSAWPVCKNAIFGKYDYVGPFFIDCGHGCFCGEDEHGAGVSSGGEFDADDHGTALQRRVATLQRSQNAIAKADLIFAWIDCNDCYGTIAEIGYAKGLQKRIWIAGSRYFRDMWFVYEMASKTSYGATYQGSKPEEVLRRWLNKWEIGEGFQFDSPIEQSFWEAWLRANERLYYGVPQFALEPQYPIGKYKVDFAHVDTKTAIELDGFATHSSTDDIANDRRRHRWIEEQGWHIIRFGGKEIHHNVFNCAMEALKLLGKRTKATH